MMIRTPCRSLRLRRLTGFGLSLVLCLAVSAVTLADWVSDTSLGISDASFWGEDQGDYLGQSLAGVGDVNGDGYDDFLIGSYGNSEGGSSAGQTYLILGRPDGWARDTLISSADASFIGEAPADSSGRSLRRAGAGDVNGDGYDDFLIAVQQNDEAGDSAGQTYLILGRPDGWVMDKPLSSVDASFLGENAGDRSGLSATGAGDVNSDGYDDIIIGSIGPSLAGMTYIIFGKETGWAMDTPLSAADASLRGEAPNDYSGSGLAGAGDVNGDGYDDFLVGARGRNIPGSADVGQTYLILGRASGWSFNLSLSHADASWLGEHAADQSGGSLAGTGDVNGDGFDDFLIGVSGNDEAGDGAGQAYLVRGRAAGWETDVSLSAADASFLGEAADDWAGTVAGTGDVNGDGFDDFLIGASGSDEGSSDAGQTYLILGRAAGWAMDTGLSLADASFHGERWGGYSGYAVAGAGDVDGNGFDDFLIGAPLDNEGGSKSGQGYLLLSDYQNPVTVSCILTCEPAAGTLPFGTLITASLLNHYDGQSRRMAGRLEARLANGTVFPSWRAGFTNIGPEAMFTSSWMQNLPALGTLVGLNTFTLQAQDVTPYPYNRPPYPPAGYTDSDSCTVEGYGP